MAVSVKHIYSTYPPQGGEWNAIVLGDGKRFIDLKARTRSLRVVCLASGKDVENDVDVFVDRVLNVRLSGKKVSVIPILEGSLFLAVDILKNITEAAEVQVRSVKASYYGEHETPGEEPLVLGDPFRLDEFKGRTVVIIDDVHDSGRTIAHIRKLLEKTDADEILVVVLVNKQKPKEYGLPDYWIYECQPNVWLGGHGMDVTIDATGALPKVPGVFRNYPGLFDKRAENYVAQMGSEGHTICRKIR